MARYLEEAIDVREATRDIAGNCGTTQTGKLFVQRLKASQS